MNIDKNKELARDQYLKHKDDILNIISDVANSAYIRGYNFILRCAEEAFGGYQTDEYKKLLEIIEKNEQTVD